MNRNRYLRVQIVKTSRTDLLCVACGSFGCGKPFLALVAPGVSPCDAQAGIHRSCLKSMRAVRARRAPADTELPPAFRTEPAPAPCTCPSPIVLVADCPRHMPSALEVES